MLKKRMKAQIGIEYMIIIGFVTFAILAVLGLSFFYSGITKDKIRLNQVEGFATQVVNSAESVFFSGEPSEATVPLYLPEGIKNITIVSNMIIITTSTSSGDNKRAYDSRVPLQGEITVNEGVKNINLQAKENYVLISG